MKKFTFTLISAIVILSTLFTFSVAAQAATPDTPTDVSTDTERNEHIAYLKNNITAEDEFADNKVLVVLYSTENPDDYTLETFSEYGVVNIKRLYDINVLILELDRHDKQNVLDVVYALYDIPGIRSADPDYYQKYDPPIVNTEPSATGVSGNLEKNEKNISTGTKDSTAIATGSVSDVYCLIAFVIALSAGLIVFRFCKVK